MFEILRIEKDYECAFYITVDGKEGWEVSPEFMAQLLKEIQNHLEGEYHLIASTLLPRFLLDQ